MFVRLTLCKFLPGRIREIRRIYNEEIAPVIRKQKGNLHASLMEPTDKADDYISVTHWKTRTDADIYEAGGQYRILIAKLEGFFVNPPTLKTYFVEEVNVKSDHL